MQADNIIKQIKSVSGLEIRQAKMPDDMSSGIMRDEKNGVTIFTAARDGKTFCFAVDGIGETSVALASLARQCVLGMLFKPPADPIVDFLRGMGGVPHGVHADKSEFFVFAVHSAGEKKGVAEYITTMADKNDIVADMGDGITALCKATDNNSDYRSAGEFAAVLKENLSEEIKDRVKIGVGGVARGVTELPKYYGYAKAALEGGGEFDPLCDIYSYKEYALVKSLSSLTSADKERYVKTVLDKSYREVLSDAELMSAADAFINHSLNISEASRHMYVHRNTLIYRLDKIERLTGLNIRNFNDAMTFRIACLVYKMI